MKLEIHTIANEEVPVIILDCEACGGEVTLLEQDVKTSRPIECQTCHHARTLSYREFMTITDRFAAALLKFLMVKLNRSKPLVC